MQQLRPRHPGVRQRLVRSSPSGPSTSQSERSLTAFLRKGFRCCRCVDMHCVSKHQPCQPVVRRDGRHTVHPSVGLRRSHHLHMPDCKFLAQTLVEATRGTSCNSLLFARGLLPGGELQFAHEEHSMTRWPSDSGDVRFRPRVPFFCG